MRPAAALVCIVAFSFAGCGGSGVDDIARNLDEAIDATSTAGRVSDGQAESAAKRTICDGLGAYSSEPAGLATDALQNYAEQQQLAAGLTLQSADPEAAQRLAGAADAIETSQDASEVASKLGC